MKKFFFWICISFLLFISIVLLFQQKKEQKNFNISERILHSVTITPNISVSHISKTLFVPYWTINKTMNISGYDRIIYFGITANTTGIIREDPGYINIDRFLLATTSGAKRLLGVRMLNTDSNKKI